MSSLGKASNLSNSFQVSNVSQGVRTSENPSANLPTKSKEDYIGILEKIDTVNQNIDKVANSRNLWSCTLAATVIGLFCGGAGALIGAPIGFLIDFLRANRAEDNAKKALEKSKSQLNNFLGNISQYNQVKSVQSSPNQEGSFGDNPKVTEVIVKQGESAITAKVYNVECKLFLTFVYGGRGYAAELDKDAKVDKEQDLLPLMIAAMAKDALGEGKIADTDNGLLAVDFINLNSDVPEESGGVVGYGDILSCLCDLFAT